jgi:hypothetical protein
MTFEKNIEIDNLDNIKLDMNENFLFHAGTTKKDNGKFMLLVAEF